MKFNAPIIKRMVDTNNVDRLEICLNGGVPCDFYLDHETSILTYAAEKGQYDVCELLLDCNCKPELSRNIEITAPSVKECVGLIDRYREMEFQEAPVFTYQSTSDNLQTLKARQNSLSKFHPIDNRPTW